MTTPTADGEYLVAWGERGARLVGKLDGGKWSMDVGKGRNGARIWAPTDKTPSWIGARVDVKDAPDAA